MMSAAVRSIYMLGADTQTEWQLVDVLGGPPHKFFQLAVRIAWGISQPDLVRVDVIDCARRMVRSHGSSFVAHLFDAWVWRARDPDRATRALERARELATPDHPLAHLMPTETDWRAEPHRQELVDAGSGVWRVAHDFPLAGAPFHHCSTATIVRTRDGDLAIFNPVAFDAAIAAQIAELGTVRWLCTQGKAHGMFIADNRRRFPGAITLGTEGHLEHPAAAYLELDGLLGHHPLPPELELIPIEGNMLDEVAVLHRPSGTLVVQDFVMPARGTWLTSLYAFAFGITTGVGFPSYALMTWKSMRAFHTSLRALRDCGFSRLATGHGPAALEPPERLAGPIEDTLSLGPVEHKLLLARFLAAQPGFLSDLVRYVRVSKRATGARVRAA